MPKRARGATRNVLEDPSIFRDRYYVRKQSGTFSDVLLLYGFAALLHEILRQALGERLEVFLADRGSFYEVTPSPSPQPEWVDSCKWFGLVPFVRTSKTAATALPGSEIRGYDEAWEQVQQALEARRASGSRKATALTSAVAQQEDIAAIAPEHWITIFIGTRQMQALTTYNRLAQIWWETRDKLSWNLRAALALFRDLATDLDQVRAAWKASTGFGGRLDVTASQMLNPHQGKGQNREKANALAMENLSSFWLVEYLKAAGLWECVAPRRVRDAEDRKTYVLAPVDLPLGAHRTVFKRFGEALWADTSVKMDCVASLLYARLLIEHSEAVQYGEDELASWIGWKAPPEVVAGFHAAQYKLLSRNAYTMINLGFIALPRWIRHLRDREEAASVRAVLDEHLGVLRGINEDRSEGFRMLSMYRSFVSSGRWEDFFQFTAGFASYLMSELDEARRQNRAPVQRSLTVPGLEVMMTMGETQFQEIVKSPGFRAVARAIRKSTVTLQYMLRDKARAQLPYEIRYGLAQELLRKSNRKEEFLQALCDFAISYNAENARVAERGENVWRREAITDSDLDDIVRLVDQHGAPTVAHLLVAYGYAREPKEESSQPTNAKETA